MLWRSVTIEHNELGTIQDILNEPKRSAPALRFLVVDDDEAFIEYIVEIIHIIGHTVVDKAYDGLQAVEIFAKEPERFDVVLMDIIMPKKNGISAAQEIRQIDSDVRIMLMSASSENQRSWSTWTNKTSSSTAHQWYPTLRWSRLNNNGGNLMWGWSAGSIKFDKDATITMP